MPVDNGWNWLEYADSIRSVFDFTRGAIVWVKANAMRTVHFRDIGNAVTFQEL